MSRLADLQIELLETSVAMTRAERSLVLHPDVPSVLATLQTFQSRHKNLEHEFLAEANLLELDVCSYRIELDNARPKIPAITAVLGSFQQLFTTIYASVANSVQRQNTRASAEIEEASSFGFGYTFPGSLGVMMTISNERMLMGETALDEAMAGVMDAMKAREPYQVKEIAQRFGVAAIRVTHQWASENSKAGFGADILWQRKEDVKARVRIQPPEIARLRAAINETTNDTDAEIVGELFMANTEEKLFKMRASGQLIEGRYTDAISVIHAATLPKQYRAKIRVAQPILKTDGEEPISYFLVSLSDQSEPSGA